MSLYNELFEEGLKTPYKKAIQYGDKIVTYSECMDLIELVARKFREIGFRSKSVVGFLIDNPFEFMIYSLALNYNDSIVMPIYSKIGSQKLSQIVKKHKINYVISNRNLEFYEIYRCKEVNIDKFKLFIKKTSDEENDIPKEVEIILLTSGTTSVPKAVMLTKNNILSTIKSIKGYLKVQPNDTVLLIKNLTHSSTFTGEFLLSIYSGITLYVSNLLPLTKNIKFLLEKHSIKILFIIPELLRELFLTNYKYSNLRVVGFSGSLASPDIIREVINSNPKINFINGYGQTEASPRITYIESKDLVRKPNSVGKPIPNVHVKIIDSWGKECGPFVKGEVIVKGPNIMKGYLGDKQKTAETIIEDTLYTKDIGYKDKEGYLYITGRADNMFVKNGKNIYPEEIESVVLSHFLIKECLVRKVKSDINVYLTIYDENINQIKKTELLQLCKESLEDYKMPNNFYIVKELQKNPNHKIIRNQVLNDYEMSEIL